MQRMWAEHGEPFDPYTVEDVEAALGEVTDPDFASDFFDRYVRGHEIPDYAALVRTVGYEIAPSRPGRVVLGFERLDFSDHGGQVTSYPSVWSPLYSAGISRGDVIADVAGAPIRGAEDLEEALEGKRAGDRVQVQVQGRLGWRKATIELADDPGVTLKLDASASPDAVRRRTEWLRSQVTDGVGSL